MRTLFSTMLLSFVLISSLSLIPALAIQKNVTVTVTNSTANFSLSGTGWTPDPPSSDLKACGWSTTTPGDSATFVFQGSALYVLGDWPRGHQSIHGTLDGEDIPWLPSPDSGQICNEYMFAKEGLQDGKYTFVVSLQDNIDSPNLSLLSITYTETVQDPAPPAGSSLTTETSTTLSSTSTSGPGSPSDVPTSTTSSTPSTTGTPQTTATSASTSPSSPPTSSSPPEGSTTESTSTSRSFTPTETSSPSISSEAPTSTTTLPTSGPSTTSSIPPPSSLSAPPSGPPSRPTSLAPSNTSRDPPLKSDTIEAPGTSSDNTSSPVVPTRQSVQSPSSSTHGSLLLPPSLVPLPSADEPTPTSSNDNFTSSTHHSGQSQRKIVIIAGSIVGGLAATALLLAASHAIINGHWIGYVLASVATALGIGAAYHTRRLIIKTCKDFKLPDTKIAIFITTGKSEPFKLDENVIVWQTSIVNTHNNSFNVDIPCTRQLRTRLFFGTYSENSQRVGVELFDEAPAILDDQQGRGPVTWRSALTDPSHVLTGVGNSRTAENRRLIPTSIVLGTGNIFGGDEKPVGMTPFLRISEENFRPGDTYELKDRLYIHAFRVNYDCQLGQTSSTIPNYLQMLDDELTKSKAIEIDTLSPVTTWNITPKQDGALSLKLVPTRREDRKKYEHECTIDPRARRGSDREALI